MKCPHSGQTSTRHGAVVSVLLTWRVHNFHTVRAHSDTWLTHQQAPAVKGSACMNAAGSAQSGQASSASCHSARWDCQCAYAAAAAAAHPCQHGQKRSSHLCHQRTPFSIHAMLHIGVQQALLAATCTAAAAHSCSTAAVRHRLGLFPCHTGAPRVHIATESPTTTTTISTITTATGNPQTPP
jgi:hypothetical protein